MNIVDAISIAHSKGVAICLREWGGYWCFSKEGVLINKDKTKVEPQRIKQYALREDFHIYPIN